MFCHMRRENNRLTSCLLSPFPHPEQNCLQALQKPITKQLGPWFEIHEAILSDDDSIVKLEVVHHCCLGRTFKTICLSPEQVNVAENSADVAEQRCTLPRISGDNGSSTLVEEILYNRQPVFEEVSHRHWSSRHVNKCLQFVDLMFTALMHIYCSTSSITH